MLVLQRGLPRYRPHIPWAFHDIVPAIGLYFLREGVCVSVRFEKTLCGIILLNTTPKQLDAHIMIRSVMDANVPREEVELLVRALAQGGVEAQHVDQHLLLRAARDILQLKPVMCIVPLVAGRAITVIYIRLIVLGCTVIGRLCGNISIAYHLCRGDAAPCCQVCAVMYTVPLVVGRAIAEMCIQSVAPVGSLMARARGGIR